MNELIKTTNNEHGEITVSGRELHEFLEVATPYTTWFERMTEYGFSEGLDFIPYLEESTGGRPRQDHQIKLDMAKEVGMIQRTEKGKQARQYFLQLERMWNSPEMVVQRAMDFQQKKIAELSTLIEVQAPKVEAYHSLMDAEGYINMAAFAKSIRIGRNTLLKRLREDDVLQEGGYHHNMPYQTFMDRGYFKVVTKVKRGRSFQVTLLTHKGAVWVAAKYAAKTA